MNNKLYISILLLLNTSSAFCMEANPARKAAIIAYNAATTESQKSWDKWSAETAKRDNCIFSCFVCNNKRIKALESLFDQATNKVNATHFALSIVNLLTYAEEQAMRKWQNAFIAQQAATLQLQTANTDLIKSNLKKQIEDESMRMHQASQELERARNQLAEVYPGYYAPGSTLLPLDDATAEALAMKKIRDSRFLELGRAALSAYTEATAQAPQAKVKLQ